MTGQDANQHWNWKLRIQRHALLSAVLLCAFTQGLFYAASIPPWDLFDEEQHLAHALTLRDERRIPHLEDSISASIPASAAATDRWSAFRLGRPLSIDVDAIGLEGRSYEAHQPPLYYVLLAPVTALSGGDPLRTLYLARLVGVLFFTGLVAVTWALARQWFPRAGQHTSAVAALTLTSVPAGAQSAGRVSNDVLAALLIGAALLALTHLLDRYNLQSGFVVGALASAAVLTKAHGLLLLPLIAVVLVHLWKRQRLRWPVAAAAMLPGSVAALAWSAWTWSRYGVLEGSRAYLDRYQTYRPLSLENFLRTFWLNSWSDYWGAYRDVIGGGLLLVVTNVILLALTSMAVVHALRHHRRSVALILPGILALEFLLALIIANHTAIVRPGGRLLLPLYPALAVLIAVCWRGCSPPISVSARHRRLGPESGPHRLVVLAVLLL